MYRKWFGAGSVYLLWQTNPEPLAFAISMALVPCRWTMIHPSGHNMRFVSGVCSSVCKIISWRIDEDVVGPLDHCVVWDQKHSPLIAVCINAETWLVLPAWLWNQSHHLFVMNSVSPDRIGKNYEFHPLCLLLIWVNHNDLTTSSLEMMVSKGNHPQMGEIQVCELF